MPYYTSLHRYKVPQTNEVILCLTDPLTSSEMKRYFNSIHALKFFKSKFMQQKRKRQYVMPVLTNNDFFSESVFLMEYGRTVLDDKNNGFASAGKMSVVRPVMNFKNEYSISGKNKIQSSKQIENDISGNNTNINSDLNGSVNVGLKVTIRTANSQYFVENLMQSILTYIALKNKSQNDPKNSLVVLNKKNSDENKIELLDVNDLAGVSIILGGDGRLFNDHAIEIAARVLSGNNVKSVILSEESFLTTAAAFSYLSSIPKKNTNGKINCITSDTVFTPFIIISLSISQLFPASK